MMVCVLCGRSKKIINKTWKNPEIRWDYCQQESPLIQIREGGGKKPGQRTATIGIRAKRRGSAPGYGFPAVETFTLEKALADPEYTKYVQAMIEQIKKLYEIVQKYR